MQQSVLATKYVKVPIQFLTGGTYMNPTADSVVMAFPASGVDPVSGDWKAAIWQTVDATTYLACCLVGPAGTIALAKGTYDVWVKVTDSPEIPAEKAGFLRIT